MYTSSLNGRDENWFSRRSLDLENAKKIENIDDRIGAIGAFLGIASHGEMDEQQKIIFNNAQFSILGIPGHANYYDKKIRQNMDDEVARNGKGDDRERAWSFETLEQLPSPETVKVLGELLYDERDPYGKPTNSGDTGPPPLNFKYASMTLTRMGIRKPPVKNTNPLRSGYEDYEIEAWKVWYEQVKAGIRTFSFEGDDTLYNLSGPTTVARDGPVQSRPDHKTSAADPENGADSNNEHRTPIIIAVLILLGIVAFTVKQRKSRIS